MNKNKILVGLFVLLMKQISYGQDNERILYKSDAFRIYGNRVEQGAYRAIAKSSNQIFSDYQSPANSFFNPVLNFKYSINGKDNETPMGVNHLLLLQADEGKPIVVRTVFGNCSNPKIGENESSRVPVNTLVHFDLDMHPVLDAFKKNGYYIDVQGNKIYESDFKGVWIAGGSEPLSWDFENLPNNDKLKMQDPDGDGVYSCELLFNPSQDKYMKTSERLIDSDLSAYPSFKCNMTLPDALYKLSIEEMMKDIRSDKTFMAGEKWDGVWTRDISYSILLSLAMLEPEIAKNSLMCKIKNKRIIQDTGTGFSWPCSTDRQIWALAAWEVYKTSGDKEWLKIAFEIISNSIEDDLKASFNAKTGLFYGESSFLDWRKQTYPVWMEPMHIYLSQNLGTNAVFFQTLNILGQMGEILQKKNTYQKQSEDLKAAINKYLWAQEKGYYGQYLYGHYNYSLSNRSEALGEALCLLFGIASKERSNEVLNHLPFLEFGIPTIYPQIPGIPPYHNQSNWPFVQAYLTWAGAKAGNKEVVELGMASIYRQCALFLTNKENMVVDNGDFKGTEINSDRQLWSVAGNLALTFRVLFGMDFKTDKLVFSPFVPEQYSGNLKITNFRYRNSILDIQITGFGNGISSFEVDGKKTALYFVNGSLSGKHTISIIMNGKMGKGQLNMVKNKISPKYPELKLEGNQLKWKAIDGVNSYRIYINGGFYKEIKDTLFDLSGIVDKGEFQVMAIDLHGEESFLSKPIFYFPENDILKFEAEQFAKIAEQKSSGYSGNGFVEFSQQDMNPFKFELSAPTSGEYLIEFRYANGSGPINTDNKCGIRALYCNRSIIGTVVFPQRGSDEWSNWGITNPLSLKLEKGLNMLELRMEPFTRNMNGDVNHFYLDQMVLIKIK